MHLEQPRRDTSKLSVEDMTVTELRSELARLRNSEGDDELSLILDERRVDEISNVLAQKREDRKAA